MEEEEEEENTPLQCTFKLSHWCYGTDPNLTLLTSSVPFSPVKITFGEP